MLHLILLVLFVWLIWGLAPLLFWAVVAPLLYVGSLLFRSRKTSPR